ncbi:hypothetical protein GCM10022245_06970 [Streptomyces mayteni]
MQGWPGAGYPPAPGPGNQGNQGNQGNDSGKRFGIWAGVIVVAVAASFGLAAATGADARGGGASAAGPVGPGGLGDPGDLGDLEGLEDFETPDFDDGTDIGGADGGGSTDGTGGTDTTIPTEEPTPTDPTLEAFQQVGSGDCLNNWMTDEVSWASDLPEVVNCDAEGAALWVSQTSEYTSDCGMSPGQSYLSYSAGLETVTLCVTRQFDVGQCFLGMSDGSANLMSWVDCEGTIPAPYSQLYNVTAVYSAPANTDGEECRSASGDDFWWWTVDDDSVLLCAVVYR